MEISEVKIFPVNEEKLKAFVSVIFDRCFMVNDIKVIQGKDALFISMPSRRKRNGEFKDVAHPLNNETRRWMEDRILGEYRRVLSGGAGESAVASAPSPASASAPAVGAGERPDAYPAATLAPGVEDRSLEEVEELHLRDSFWSVP